MILREGEEGEGNGKRESVSHLTHISLARKLKWCATRPMRGSRKEGGEVGIGGKKGKDGEKKREGRESM